MTELIACLGTGKGTWSYVSRLIESGEWDKVYLVTNDFGVRKFKKREGIGFIVIDDNLNVKEMKKVIKKQLEKKTNSIEVAVDMTSGSGKEHMALLSSLLGIGLGFRLVTLEKGEVKEL